MGSQGRPGEDRSHPEPRADTPLFLGGVEHGEDGENRTLAGPSTMAPCRIGTKGLPGAFLPPSPDRAHGEGAVQVTVPLFRGAGHSYRLRPLPAAETAGAVHAGQKPDLPVAEPLRAVPKAPAVIPGQHLMAVPHSHRHLLAAG